MRRYIYFLMVGVFFTTFLVLEVEAQREDPRGGDPRVDTRDTRGPGDVRDTRGPGDVRDPRGGDPRGGDPRVGGDTAPDDRPWRDILKNCRQMKKRGALSRAMKQECKAARKLKKESRQ